MIIKIGHTLDKAKKASSGKLTDHLTYLGDTAHPDHAGLILHPAKNYGCGPTAADFVVAVEAQKTYLEACNGKSVKRTADTSTEIWEELVNNMGEGCYHTEVEREAIERKLIDEICPDSPARTVWSENPVTGEGVLRAIFPTSKERNTTSLCKRMRALDEQIADMLNTSSNKPAKRKSHIPTAQEVAKDRAKKTGKPGKP